MNLLTIKEINQINKYLATKPRVRLTGPESAWASARLEPMYGTIPDEGTYVVVEPNCLRKVGGPLLDSQAIRWLVYTADDAWATTWPFPDHDHPHVKIVTIYPTLKARPVYKGGPASEVHILNRTFFMKGLSLYKNSLGGPATGLNVIITYIRSAFEYTKLLQQSQGLEREATMEAFRSWGTYITQVTNATEPFTEGEIEAQQYLMDHLYGRLCILNSAVEMSRDEPSRYNS